MTSDEVSSEIRFDEQDSRGRYSLTLGDGSEAELTFSRDEDGDMVAGHTFVPPGRRGQGVATRLVERAVADAEAGGFKILPLCPFVATEFRHHPEWAALAKR